MALIPGSFVDSRVDLHYLVSLVMSRLIAELYQPKGSLATNWDKHCSPYGRPCGSCPSHLSIELCGGRWGRPVGSCPLDPVWAAYRLLAIMKLAHESDYNDAQQ